MIHLFDVDYTVIKKPSAWYFLRQGLSEGVIRFSQVNALPLEWVKYKLGRPNMDFIETAVTHLAGIEKSVLEHIAAACFERLLRPNIYTGAAALIQKAQSRGEPVFFATSSFNFIIKPLEDFFGITGSIASALEFSGGKTTGRVAGGSFFGERKKTAVEAWLAEQAVDRSEIRFYSDSWTDIPLLEFAGQAAAVNPDRVLARQAQKQGWEILRFRETLGPVNHGNFRQFHLPEQLDHD
ncbi:MAG: HAD-IB family hydrolase [Treponema sp.]|jgi:HAD superfamily hydrolase (TIGR01490 family)|nr:HAD-IB family hydrolase [Treponema sp.]